MSGPDVEGVLRDHFPIATQERRAHVAAALRAEVRAWLESVLDDGVTKSLPVAEWAADPLPSCPQYAHVNPDWLLAIIGEAKAMRVALAALAEQVGQVASVGEGEGS